MHIRLPVISAQGVCYLKYKWHESMNNPCDLSGRLLVGHAQLNIKISVKVFQDHSMQTAKRLDTQLIQQKQALASIGSLLSELKVSYFKLDIR